MPTVPVKRPTPRRRPVFRLAGKEQQQQAPEPECGRRRVKPVPRRLSWQVGLRVELPLGEERKDVVELGLLALRFEQTFDP